MADELPLDRRALKSEVVVGGEVEASVSEQEKANRQIADRIARMNAEHEVTMRYLIEFGVRALERAEFQRILEEMALVGGLRLQEAAGLAHARVMAAGQRSNGEGDGGSSSMESSAA
ncbi:MAG: hypothetical protein KDA86_20220 [Planctomycetaceae bacterium]|nr:hypothetical protein [Planctomycetaceae bacterium]